MICNNYQRNLKLGLCTSHGFNYEQLEKIVLQYIYIKIVILINLKLFQINKITTQNTKNVNAITKNKDFTSFVNIVTKLDRKKAKVYNYKEVRTMINRKLYINKLLAYKDT